MSAKCVQFVDSLYIHQLFRFCVRENDAFRGCAVNRLTCRTLASSSLQSSSIAPCGPEKSQLIPCSRNLRLARHGFPLRGGQWSPAVGAGVRNGLAWKEPGDHLNSERSMVIINVTGWLSRSLYAGRNDDRKRGDHSEWTGISPYSSSVSYTIPTHTSIPYKIMEGHMRSHGRGWLSTRRMYGSSQVELCRIFGSTGPSQPSSLFSNGRVALYHSFIRPGCVSMVTNGGNVDHFQGYPRSNFIRHSHGFSSETYGRPGRMSYSPFIVVAHSSLRSDNNALRTLGGTGFTHARCHFSAGKDGSEEPKNASGEKISFRDPKYKTGWKCLLRCIHLERFMVIPTMVALLISSAVISSFPLAVGNFVNNFSVSDNPPIPLYMCILAVVAAALSSFAKSTLSILVGDRIAMRLRKETFSRLIEKGIPFYDSNTSGALCSVLTSDVIVASNVVNHICHIIRSGITFLAGTALSLTLAPISLFVYTVLPVAAAMFVIFPYARYGSTNYPFFCRHIQRLSATKLKNISLMAEHANQRFSNMRTVKAFNAEALECHTFHNRLLDIMKVAKKIAMYSGVTNFIAVGAVGTLILLMAHNSAYLVLSGSMRVGDVTSLLMYSALIGGSVQGFTSGLSEIQKCVGASQALQNIHKWEASCGMATGMPIGVGQSDGMPRTTPSIHVPKGTAIHFDSVTFAYPTRPNVKVLDNVSFSIKEGKKLVVMGSTGCGKTTLFQLLLGFYEPNCGSIFVNGKSLAEIGDKNLRKEMSWVEQLGVLFDDTIRSNAVYSVDAAQFSRNVWHGDSCTANLDEVYKLADLDNFLKELPEGDGTLVGQNGYSLSGGQRQRILIARALVKDSPIILLDEPTSALDMKSEDIIKKNLQLALANKTAIITTHRTSMLSLADYIMCMDGGKVCQFGTREEVLKNPCEILSKILPIMMIPE